LRNFLHFCGKVFLLEASLAAALAQSGVQPTSPGFVCKATDGERTVTFVMPTGDFTLQPDQSIDPQLKPSFKAEWDGFLTIDRPGVYALILTDGKKVTGHQQLKVDAGLMPVHFSFERQPGQAQQQLWWESEFFRREPIPWDACVHRETPAGVANAEDIARGRELVENLNCVACHKTDKPFVRGRAAPILTGAGSRLKPAWIFQWLENPHHFRATAVMPAFSLSEQDRADLTACLAAQTAGTAGTALPSAASEREGGELFAKFACAGCHSDQSAPLAGMGSKMEPAALAGYLQNPLAVDPSGRMPGQYLTFSEAASLALYLAASKDPAFEKAPPAGDAAHGRELMTTRGCLNCHALEEAGVRLETKLTAPALAALHDGGCLAENPGANVPHFDLTPAQRQSLRAYLQSPDVSEAPVQDFQRKIEQFNCTTCHALHGPSKLSFPPNQMPPSLVDAGNKLRRSWIEAVFAGKRGRPWLAARMPDFGRDNIAFFFDGFAEQAGAELGEGMRLTNGRVDMVSDGMDLIGTDAGGLSCITCHGFRGVPAGAETRGPDLTEIDDQVRTDWAYRYLSQPSRIVHGTVMPDFFVGKPEWMVGRDLNRLLEALAMGPKMPAPSGWRQDPLAYVIEVTNQPVLFHCFLTDASPRAIAVGLPGKVSYCFDAYTCQLRFVWTGAFLDVKSMWTLRGAGPAKVLGQKCYTAPAEFPLRVGDPDKTPQVRYLGYDLIGGYPQFRYEVNGVLVRELITLQEGAAATNRLACHFDLGAVDKDVWFDGGPEAAVTGALAPSAAAKGWWKIPGGSSVRFTVEIPVKPSS
jgi:mono/diheme cytochrome c family protein